MLNVVLFSQRGQAGCSPLLALLQGCDSSSVAGFLLLLSLMTGIFWSQFNRYLRFFQCLSRQCSPVDSQVIIWSHVWPVHYFVLSLAAWLVCTAWSNCWVKITCVGLGITNHRQFSKHLQAFVCQDFFFFPLFLIKQSSGAFQGFLIYRHHLKFSCGTREPGNILLCL